MHEIIELIEQGGSVMPMLILVSILLYERCFHLLIRLLRSHRLIRNPDIHLHDTVLIQRCQDQLDGFYRRNLIIIKTMIASAPLLGLLGTVMGMIATFESLGNRAGENTIKGLSDGISMALITTETGLAIAIPAVLILHYAQRHLNSLTQQLILLEGESRK